MFITKTEIDKIINAIETKFQSNCVYDPSTKKKKPNQIGLDHLDAVKNKLVDGKVSPGNVTWINEQIVRHKLSVNLIINDDEPVYIDDVFKGKLPKNSQTVAFVDLAKLDAGNNQDNSNNEINKLENEILDLVKVATLQQERIEELERRQSETDKFNELLTTMFEELQNKVKAIEGGELKSKPTNEKPSSQSIIEKIRSRELSK